MHTRLPLLVALAALGSFACGPAPEPVAPPAPSASAVASVAPPLPPASSAPVVKAPEVKPPPAEPSDLASEADMNDTVTHLRVPVGSSPVDGKPTALITLVLFSDFEDPFSFHELTVIRDLQKKYGDDLRLVWKDFPLTFHPMAIPMLLAARDAREARGDAAFWQAFTILFDEHAKLHKLNDAILKDNEKRMKANPPLPQKSVLRLGEPQFKDAARQLKISSAKQKDMLATKLNPPVIADDTALAADLRVTGTPTFFINGRRLVGAQPPEVLTKMIEEELVVARELVASGTERGKVYETLQGRALRPKPREKAPSSGAGMGPSNP
jgi:protein-disulfide isomerase